MLMSNINSFVLYMSLKLYESIFLMKKKEKYYL